MSSTDLGPGERRDQSRGQHRPRLAALAILPALLAGACTFAPASEMPAYATPKAEPVKNLTSFSEALTCMDELMLGFGINDVVVTSPGIPDATGEIKTGTKEMLISAISRMSIESNGYRFVDFDQSEGQKDVNVLWSTIGQSRDFQIPQYYIRGAISQLDENVVSQTQSGSLAVQGLQLGASRDQVMSVVTVDLNVADLQTRQILPGMTAHNSITVRRANKGADGQGTIEKYGLSFNIAFNTSEGMHQAVRTLIELSTIEVLGKLAEVPYWRCLSMQQTNPAVVAQAREFYNRMNDQAKVRFVQRALAGLGRYQGTVSGTLDEPTRASLASWQAEKGLIGDGRIDFNTYAALIQGDLAATGHAPPANARPAAAYQPALAEEPRHLRATLTTSHGPAATFKTGDSLQALLYATKDAFAYCYYKDAQGRVSRIFPNRFQPAAAIAAGHQIDVPATGAGFSIDLDQAGQSEDVRCLVAEHDPGPALPDFTQGPDLAPLPFAMPEVSQAFHSAAGTDLVEVDLPVTVVQR